MDKIARTVSIRIGKQIDITNPTRHYKLVVENMHGDADAETYQETTFDSDNPKEMECLHELLLFLEDCANWRYNRDEGREVYDAIEAKYEYYMELVENDATCDFQFACRPTLSTLTYFDEEGTEFDVQVKYTYGKGKS